MSRTNFDPGRLPRFFLGIQPLRAPEKLPFLRGRPCGPSILVQFELRSLRNNTIDLASSLDPLVPRRFVFRPESLLGWIVVRLRLFPVVRGGIRFGWILGYSRTSRDDKEF